jgi:hypothetical protein
MERRNNHATVTSSSQKQEVLVHEYLANKVTNTRDLNPQNTPAIRMNATAHGMKVLPPIKAISNSVER